MSPPSSTNLEYGSDSLTVSENPSVSEIIEEWPEDTPFDAAQILEQNPDLRRHKSNVIDLAYEEYCRRIGNKEDLSLEDFVGKFEGIQRSLACLIDVHKFLNANPELITDISSLPWPKIGDILLDLEFVEELGQGAFSRVFLVRELKVGNRISVAKVCAYGDEEASILGQLDAHQNIVPVRWFRTDEETGLTVICMPYLGRATLLDLIDAIVATKSIPTDVSDLLDSIKTIHGKGEAAVSGQESIRSAWKRSFTEAVIDIGLQLAGALEFSHRHFICHGDMKPSNVLLNPDGRVLLLDFNLSFKTQSEKERKGGTLPYMSPEQLSRVLKGRFDDQHEIDEQSDLFSLGVLLYELFTGKHPFGFSLSSVCKKEAAAELLEKQERGVRSLQELNPHLDANLIVTVEKCLAFKPEERWKSAADLKQAFQEMISWKYRTVRWIKNHKKTVFASIATVFLMLSIAVYSVATRPPLDVRRVNQGKVALEEERFEDAIPLFEEAIEWNPDSFDAHFNLGLALLRAEPPTVEKLDRSFREFDRCREMSQGDHVVSACQGHSRALLAFHSGGVLAKPYFQSAVRFYKEAYGEQRVSEAALQNNLGVCYEFLRDYEQAQNHYLEAEKLNDQLEQVYYNLARTNRRQASHEKIPRDLTYLRRFLELNPNHLESYRDAAMVYAYLCKSSNSGPEQQQHLEKCLEHCRLAVGKGLTRKGLESVSSLFPSLKENKTFNGLLRKAESNDAFRAEKYSPFVDPLTGD